MERKYKNPNRRFYIIIGVLVIAIAVLLVVVLYHGTEDITERDAMSLTIDTNAIIIRDETIVSAAEFTRIDYDVVEGQQVANGEKLADVYKLGFSDEYLLRLISERENVYNAQIAALGSTKDAELDAMNAEIQALRNRISAAVMCDSGEDLLQIQFEFQQKLAVRMEYLKTKVQATETLNALYAAVQSREDTISAWISEVSANTTGRVSFYFDGYEQAINAEKLSMLTPDLVKRALAGSSASTWTTDDRTHVARIIDSDHWYAAFLTNSKDAVRLAEGVEYTVTLEGYGTFTGVALTSVVNGKSVINILEFNTEMGELSDVRITKIEVSAMMTGIKISDAAVQVKDGYCYVELVYSETHRMMQIDVLTLADGFALVRPYNSEDTLGEGVMYWIP